MRAVTVLLVMGVIATSSAARGSPPKGDYVELAGYSRQTERFDESAWEVRLGFERTCTREVCVNWAGHYRPVHFQCSANRRTGLIGECYWVLVAMHIELDEDSGDTHSSTIVTECRIPLPEQVGAVEFANAMFVEDPLHIPLPGINRSLWSLSKECIPGRFL